MTRLEVIKCEELAKEAIQYADESERNFEEMKRCHNTTEKHISELKAWNHRGCAEGIIQALNVIGFKNEVMEKLNKLL